MVEELRVIGGPKGGAPFLPKGWDLAAVIGEDERGRQGLRALCLLPSGDAVKFTEGGVMPAAGVTVSLWRSVPIGEFTDEALRISAQVEEWQATDEREWQEAWATRRGPPGHPDKLYAELAQQFLTYVASGNRAPLERLAGVNGWPRATAARRIREARSRGLLTSPSKGQVGGELTTRAGELLGAFPLPPADVRL